MISDETLTGTQLKLLQAIDAMTTNPNGATAAAARDFAEAYAWLTSPAQPHGGSTKITNS
ncbi:MAG: hypothetical protein ACPGVY_11155 [Mycobacterium sp.]